MAGATAEGGGDFTVVSDLELELVVLVDVDSVCITSANTDVDAAIIQIVTNLRNMIVFFLRLFDEHQKTIMYSSLVSIYAPSQIDIWFTTFTI
jgi:hypothetical protein